MRMWESCQNISPPSVSLTSSTGADSQLLPERSHVEHHQPELTETDAQRKRRWFNLPPLDATVTGTQGLGLGSADAMLFRTKYPKERLSGSVTPQRRSKRSSLALQKGRPRPQLERSRPASCSTPFDAAQPPMQAGCRRHRDLWISKLPKQKPV